MNALIQYLLDNMMIDFQGELSLDMVRDFLREDRSRAAEQLMARLIADRGASDMMIALADCLKEHLTTGINEQVVLEQLTTYAES